MIDIELEITCIKITMQIEEEISLDITYSYKRIFIPIGEYLVNNVLLVESGRIFPSK